MQKTTHSIYRVVFFILIASFLKILFEGNTVITYNNIEHLLTVLSNIDSCISEFKVN